MHRSIPGASDLCDGLINDCTVSDLTDAESDVDGDGFVECTIDPSGWVGDSKISLGVMTVMMQI